MAPVGKNVLCRSTSILRSHRLRLRCNPRKQISYRYSAIIAAVVSFTIVMSQEMHRCMKFVIFHTRSTVHEKSVVIFT